MKKKSGGGAAQKHLLFPLHDPGGLQGETLEPGRIFTIEPQFRIEEEHLGIRLEDMILITDSGYENLSQFVPIEVKDIEKLMAERGLSDAAIARLADK